MDITLVFGYIGALLIGVVLGLVGGGGSILTVPVLVYLFGIAPVLATAYSLFIVGLAEEGSSKRNDGNGDNSRHDDKKEDPSKDRHARRHHRNSSRRRHHHHVVRWMLLLSPPRLNSSITPQRKHGRIVQ